MTETEMGQCQRVQIIERNSTVQESDNRYHVLEVGIRSCTKWYILMFKPKCFLQRLQFANVLDKAILAITWNAILLLAEMFIITHLKFEL